MFTIYTKEACEYCLMAKEEMHRLGISFEEFLVAPPSLLVEGVSPAMAEVLEKSGHDVMTLTFPQIFNSNGKHIGGYMDLLDYTEEVE